MEGRKYQLVMAGYEQAGAPRVPKFFWVFAEKACANLR